MARYPPGLESSALFYHNLFAVAAVEAAVVAAASAAGAIDSSSSSTHLPSAIYLAAASRVCRRGCIMRRNEPYYLAWYAVSAGNKV